jgi:hypothetical protein
MSFWIYSKGISNNDFIHTIITQFINVIHLLFNIISTVFFIKQLRKSESNLRILTVLILSLITNDMVNKRNTVLRI